MKILPVQTVEVEADENIRLEVVDLGKRGGCLLELTFIFSKSVEWMCWCYSQVPVISYTPSIIVLYENSCDSLKKGGKHKCQN